MEEIRARNLRRVSEAETLFVDPASGARTMLHELEGEVDVAEHTFAAAASTGDQGFYRNKRSRRVELGRCLTRMGRYAEAQEQLLEAHRVLDAAVGDGHIRTIRAVRALANLYEAWGKPDRAAVVGRPSPEDDQP